MHELLVNDGPESVRDETPSDRPCTRYGLFLRFPLTIFRFVFIVLQHAFSEDLRSVAAAVSIAVPHRTLLPWAVMVI